MTNEMRRAKLLLRATEINDFFFMKNLKSFFFLDKLVEALAECEDVNFDRVEMALDICDLFSVHEYEYDEDLVISLVAGVING